MLLVTSSKTMFIIQVRRRMATGLATTAKQRLHKLRARVPSTGELRQLVQVGYDIA